MRFFCPLLLYIAFLVYFLEWETHTVATIQPTYHRYSTAKFAPCGMAGCVCDFRVMAESPDTKKQRHHHHWGFCLPMSVWLMLLRFIKVYPWPLMWSHSFHSEKHIKKGQKRETTTTTNDCKNMIPWRPMFFNSSKLWGQNYDEIGNFGPFSWVSFGVLSERLGFFFFMSICFCEGRCSAFLFKGFQRIKKKKGCEPKHSYSECKLKRDPLGGGEPQDIYIYNYNYNICVYVLYYIHLLSNLHIYVVNVLTFNKEIFGNTNLSRPGFLTIHFGQFH